MRLALLLSAVLWFLVIAVVRAEPTPTPKPKTDREKYLEDAIDNLRGACRSDFIFPEFKSVCPNKRQIIRIYTKILNGTWDGFKGCLAGQKR